MTKRYRAWNHYAKFMIPPENVAGYERDQQALLNDGIAPNDPYYDPYTIASDEELTLLMASARQDTNGTTVCEGDIATVKTTCGADTGIVTQIGDMLMVVCTHVAPILVSDENVPITVVGNIYEHPEKAPQYASRV